MNKYWRYLKYQVWHMILPLLLVTVFGATASAAQGPSFGVVASGSTNKLTLNANLGIGDVDAGRNGNIYLGFDFLKNWYFNNGSGWVRFDGGPLPVYATEPLSSRMVEVVRNTDLSGFVGGKLYVGYGLSESDMVTGGKYGMVYAVTADTTSPTVTGTIHSNGATNVAINTKVGATFSEEMDPLTVTTATFTLKQGTTTVPGTVSYSGVTAVFTPTSNLASSTAYTVTVSKGVKDLAGNTLTRDFVIGWTTAALADTTPPTLTSTTHANGSTNVPINTKVSVTFSEGMDPSTITNGNFTVKDTATGVAVAGTVSYSGVSAVFTPTSYLIGNNGYTVTVKGGTGGAKDLAGNPLASDFAVGWTTAVVLDTTAPTAVGTFVVGKFSEEIDPLTITNVNFTLMETATGTTVPGTISYSGVSAMFVPVSSLMSSTGYTATIKGGTNGPTDLAGNPLASDLVWSWTTAAAADTIAPTVAGTTQASGATNVAINTKVGAAFSEEMAPLAMTNVNFTLKETVSGTAVAGTVSYTGLNAVFTPLRSLTPSTSYTATIKGGSTGVGDLAGNTLALDYVWTWTTGTTLRDPVLLGTAGNFAILAKTGISTVPTSIITGDIGVSPVAATYLTGFSLSADATNVFSTSTQVVGGGKIYAADMAVPTPANLTTAVLDMQTAYTDAAGRTTPDFLNLGGGTIAGLTLAPGLYKWGSSVMITTDVTISGSANDVWIFQMSGDLIMSAAKRITLSGGALAKNIFWQVAGQATIGTTAHFEGNILSQTGITLQTGATMNGRALAQSLVALQSATVTKPAP